MTDTDKKNIYDALVNLLTTYCDTCTDKQQMNKILLCAFKLDLIEYATSNNYDTVEELWESIARTLKVDLSGETSVITNRVCNCSNGVCSLC